MKYPIGTKVDVWSEDENDDLGRGTIIDYDRMTILGETIYIDQDIPTILLSDGSTIRGHECEYGVVDWGHNMCKNRAEKEPGAFEQEIQSLVRKLEIRIADRGSSSNAPYSEGMAEGYRYALAIYRECRKGGTI